MSQLNKITEAKSLPVLQALCEATDQVLRPVDLRENDYLVLDLDDDARHFLVEARSLERVLPPKRQFLVDEDSLTGTGDKVVVDRKSLQEGPKSKDTFEIDGKVFKQHWTSISRDAANWATRCPERSEIGHGRWKLAVTDYTALVAYHSWPADRLLFKNDATRDMFYYLVTRFLSQTKVAETIAKFKIAGEVPTLPADFIEHPDNPLLPYQRVPIACFTHAEAAALFQEQGTGKTPVAINRVCFEAARKRAGKIPGLKNTIYRVLIVCPRQLRMNWSSEFEKFATVPGKVAALRGGELGRARILYETVRDEPGCAFAAAIISMDSVASSLEALRRVAWDLIIVDESHNIKSRGTDRWKTLVMLRQQHVRQRMILTGTPIANTVMDLWAQLEFLGEGLSGFQSFDNFKAFHGSFKTIPVGSTSIQKLVAIKNTPLLQERLARLSFIITKAEAGLNLPDKVYDIYEVEMTSRQSEYYDKMVDQLLIEIQQMEEEQSAYEDWKASGAEGSGPPPKRMSADHVLTKLLRLAQITSGHVKWNREDDGTAGKVEQIQGVNPKVEAVVELLTEPGRDPKGKTIIWATFREDIRVITERLAKEGIRYVVFDGSTSEKQREIAIESFNKDPGCRVFVANPAAASTGLNLLGFDPNDPERFDTYCDHEIFFSQNWSAVQRVQAEDRAHRKGTKTNVRITDLVVPETIDEEIRARVTAKLTMALQIQDVREILKNVLQRSS